jgi:cytoskeletal protein RodZ
MQESFGARLRQRREAQQIALVTIAEETKIKLSLLEALERDDVSHWPAGIFRRAFIRAYAHGIGLNPDEVVREFVEVHPEPADLLAAAAAVASAAESDRMHAAPPTRFRTMVGSAIGSLSRLRRAPATGDQPAPDARLAEPDDFEDFERPAVSPGSSLASTAPSSAPEPTPPAKERAPEPQAERTVAAGRQSEAAGPDFSALADVCTAFGRVEHADDVQPLLDKAAALLDATGVIVWIWDAAAEQLSPALVHGYSDKVLAQLPTVGRDADNPTAAAFRSGEVRAIDGSEHTSGALVLPLLAPGGCAGVLAIELQQGRALSASVRAAATILAALLAQLVGGPCPAVAEREAEPGEGDATVRHVEAPRPSYESAALTR